MSSSLAQTIAKMLQHEHTIVHRSLDDDDESMVSYTPDESLRRYFVLEAAHGMREVLLGPEGSSGRLHSHRREAERGRRGPPGAGRRARLDAAPADPRPEDEVVETEADQISNLLCSGNEPSG
jgi:hypothetical protein